MNRPLHGTDPEDEDGQRWFVDVWEQWSGLFHRCNWYDFTLIQLQGEFAPYTGRCEAHAALLGLHVRVTYVYSQHFNREMRSLRDVVVEEIKARTGAEEVIDLSGALDEIERAEKAKGKGNGRSHGPSDRASEDL